VRFVSFGIKASIGLWKHYGSTKPRKCNVFYAQMGVGLKAKFLVTTIHYGIGACCGEICSCGGKLSHNLKVIGFKSYPRNQWFSKR